MTSPPPAYLGAIHCERVANAILDGIMAIGSTWNVVQVPHGFFRLEIKQPTVHTGNRYKGIYQVNEKNTCIQIALANVGPLFLDMLIVPLRKPKITKQFKSRLRSDVIMAIKEAIKMMSPDNRTRRENMYLMDENVVIHSQVDWDSLATHVREEVLMISLDNESGPKRRHTQMPHANGNYRVQPRRRKVIRKRDQSHSPPPFQVFFLAHLLGQSREVTSVERYDFAKSSMADYYSVLRHEHVETITIHWATDFCSGDHSLYAAFFDAKYISSLESLEGRGSTKKFFPQCGLGGVGNLQFRFPEGSHTNIAALQLYSSWADFLRKSKSRYFVQPSIAESISKLSEFVIKYKQIGLIRVQKLNKERELLSGAPTRMLEGLLDIFETGKVRLRIEVVWSSNSVEPIEIVLKKSMMESFNWLENVGLLSNHHIFQGFDKVELMRWLRTVLCACIKRINKHVIPFQGKKIREEKSILGVKDDAILSSQDFCSILAAESVISYFLSGNPGRLVPRAAIILGLKCDATSHQPYIGHDTRIDNDGLLTYVGEINTADGLKLSSWFFCPLLPFLRAVKQAIHGPAEPLSIAAIKYCLAHAAILNGRSLSVSQNSDVFWMLDETFPMHKRFVISTEEMVTKLTQNLLLVQIPEIRKKYDLATNMLKQLYEYRLHGKRILSARRIWKALDNLIIEKKLPFVVPFPGDQLYAAMPTFSPAEHDPSHVMSSWKNVYVWYLGKNKGAELSPLETEDFQLRFGRIRRDPSNLVEFFQ